MIRYSVTIFLMAAGLYCAHAQQNAAAQKMGMTLYAVSEMYVDPVNMDSLVNVQIAEMVSKLDPYSKYMPASQARLSESFLLGETPRAGIGAELFIADGGTARFSFIRSGGPAHQAGIRLGDRLLSVDGVSINGKNVAGSGGMLRGEEDSPVRIEVDRKGTVHNFTVLRQASPGTNVMASYMLDTQTGYVAISMFSHNTAEEFREILANLKDTGMRDLVLDIRENPGGFFDTALGIADEFISAGRLLVTTEGKNTGRQDITSQTEGIFEQGRLAVLINERTMSAAEILAGALQDWDRGVIVGGTSFGKGLIQETLPFDDGSALQITVARYLTPSGRSIQKPYQEDISTGGSEYKTMLNSRTVNANSGIEPDIKVTVDIDSDTGWYDLISTTNLHKAAAVQYALLNGDAILQKHPDPESFRSGFKGRPVLDKLIEMADENSIPLNGEDHCLSSGKPETELKALLARHLYGSNLYYHQIMGDSDPVIRTALEIIKEGRYERILTGK